MASSLASPPPTRRPGLADTLTALTKSRQPGAGDKVKRARVAAGPLVIPAPSFPEYIAQLSAQFPFSLRARQWAELSSSVETKDSPATATFKRVELLWSWFSTAEKCEKDMGCSCPMSHIPSMAWKSGDRVQVYRPQAPRMWVDAVLTKVEKPSGVLHANAEYQLQYEGKEHEKPTTEKFKFRLEFIRGIPTEAEIAERAKAESTCLALFYRIFLYSRGPDALVQLLQEIASAHVEVKEVKEPGPSSFSASAALNAPVDPEKENKENTVRTQVLLTRLLWRLEMMHKKLPAKVDLCRGEFAQPIAIPAKRWYDNNDAFHEAIGHVSDNSTLPRETVHTLFNFLLYGSEATCATKSPKNRNDLSIEDIPFSRTFDANEMYHIPTLLLALSNTSLPVATEGLGFLNLLILRTDPNAVAILSTEGWQRWFLTLLTGFSGGNEAEEGGEANLGQVLQLSVSVVVMLLYRHFLHFNPATLSAADQANPRPPPLSRDMKTVIWDTFDIIEQATGWHNETVVLLRVLLSSLCSRIQSAPREFMSEPKHHSWNNLLDIMSVLENFAYYSPLVENKAPRPMEQRRFHYMGMHYHNGSTSDPQLLRKMFDTFAALKVPAMTPDPYPEPAMKLVVKKLKATMIAEMEFLKESIQTMVKVSQLRAARKLTPLTVADLFKKLGASLEERDKERLIAARKSSDVPRRAAAQLIAQLMAVDSAIRAEEKASAPPQTPPTATHTLATSPSPPVSSPPPANRDAPAPIPTRSPPPSTDGKRPAPALPSRPAVLPPRPAPPVPTARPVLPPRAVPATPTVGTTTPATSVASPTPSATPAVPVTSPEPTSTPVATHTHTEDASAPTPAATPAAGEVEVPSLSESLSETMNGASGGDASTPPIATALSVDEELEKYLERKRSTESTGSTTSALPQPMAEIETPAPVAAPPAAATEELTADEELERYLEKKRAEKLAAAAAALTAAAAITTEPAVATPAATVEEDHHEHSATVEEMALTADLHTDDTSSSTPAVEATPATAATTSAPATPPLVPSTPCANECGGAATHSCRECQVALCQPCITATHGSVIFRRHLITPLAPKSPAVVPVSAPVAATPPPLPSLPPVPVPVPVVVVTPAAPAPVVDTPPPIPTTSPPLPTGRPPSRRPSAETAPVATVGSDDIATAPPVSLRVPPKQPPPASRPRGSSRGSALQTPLFNSSESAPASSSTSEGGSDDSSVSASVTTSPSQVPVAATLPPSPISASQPSPSLTVPALPTNRPTGATTPRNSGLGVPPPLPTRSPVVAAGHHPPPALPSGAPPPLPSSAPPSVPSTEAVADEQVPATNSHGSTPPPLPTGGPRGVPPTVAKRASGIGSGSLSRPLVLPPPIPTSAPVVPSSPSSSAAVAPTGDSSMGSLSLGTVHEDAPLQQNQQPQQRRGPAIGGLVIPPSRSSANGLTPSTPPPSLPTSPAPATPVEAHATESSPATISIDTTTAATASTPATLLSPTPATSAWTPMETIYNYRALKPDQISYTKGTMLMVAVLAGRNWCHARNPATGEAGIVALSFVKPYVAPTPAIGSPPTNAAAPTPVASPAASPSVSQSSSLDDVSSVAATAPPSITSPPPPAAKRAPPPPARFTRAPSS